MEISLYPGAKLMGEWITVAPASRAASKTFSALSKVLLADMESLTAACSTPPSEVKSFWNSMKTTAVESMSMAFSLASRWNFSHKLRIYRWRSNIGRGAKVAR